MQLESTTGRCKAAKHFQVTDVSKIANSNTIYVFMYLLKAKNLIFNVISHKAYYVQ